MGRSHNTLDAHSGTGAGLQPDCETDLVLLIKIDGLSWRARRGALPEAHIDMKTMG